MEEIRKLLSEPWNSGLGAWATVAGTLIALVLLVVTIKRLWPGGGRGGSATVENADGEAYGGNGGSTGRQFGPGGDGGSAKVVGGRGKAVGGEGGDVR